MAQSPRRGPPGREGAGDAAAARRWVRRERGRARPPMRRAGPGGAPPELSRALLAGHR